MDGVPPANLLGGWKSGHIVAATPFCPGQGWTYSVFPELRRAELAPSGSHAINCENIWDSRGVKAERKRRCRIEDWGCVFPPCQGDGVSASACSRLSVWVSCLCSRRIADFVPATLSILHLTN